MKIMSTLMCPHPSYVSYGGTQCSVAAVCDRRLEFGHFLKGGADNLVCPFGFHKEAKSVAAEMNVS